MAKNGEMIREMMVWDMNRCKDMDAAAVHYCGTQKNFLRLAGLQAGI